MYKILIALFIISLFTFCILIQEVRGEERTDDFSLKKKDYKMEKKDYEVQILMILILVTLAFVIG